MNIGKYMNNIKFLLIQRRHSIGFMDFIRGKYKIDNIEQINSLFQYMHQNEINLIKTLEFEDLWKEIWNNDETKINLKKDFTIAKEKFIELKTSTKLDLNLEFYLNNIEQNKGLNAFVFVFKEQAIERAKWLDTQFQSGNKIGKLHGVIIGIKDNICFKDHPSSAGSGILQNFNSIYVRYLADGKGISDKISLFSIKMLLNDSLNKDTSMNGTNIVFSYSFLTSILINAFLQKSETI